VTQKIQKEQGFNQNGLGFSPTAKAKATKRSHKKKCKKKKKLQSSFCKFQIGPVPRGATLHRSRAIWVS